jgi:hypothetical protein
MSRWVALLWATASLAGAQDPGTTSEELPAIHAVQGDLHLWSSAKDKLAPVTEAVRVAPNDRLGTRKDKLAVLATQDGSLISLSDVEVGREKGLALERTKDKLVLKLFKGKIALETFQTGLRVETPNAVVEGGPSCCVVQVDGKKTRIFVENGALTLVNTLGSVKVAAGQESTAEKTTKPSEPKPADLEKATSETAAATGSLTLVKNPGFEEGLKDWYVEQINGRDAVTLENGLAHSGRQCARLEISSRIFGPRLAGWLGFKQNLRLVPGKRYLVRAYARLECREGSVNPFISIAAQKGPQWTVDPSVKSWQRLGGVYVPEIDNGSRISAEAIASSERYDATLWLDDFLVLELK